MDDVDNAALGMEIHTFDHRNDSEAEWSTAIDAMKQMALDIEGVCEGRGWEGDEQYHNTFLGAVFITIDEPVESNDDSEVHTPEVCWVSPLPVPGFVATNLPHYLPIIADTAPLGMSLWRQSWAENVAPVGCVVTFEGWSLPVPIDKMTPEQKEAADRHEIHLREDRVEERHVLLYLYDGQAVVVERKRGQEPNVVIVPPNDENLKLRGTVPNAMRALTKAVTGVLWEGGE